MVAEAAFVTPPRARIRVGQAKPRIAPPVPARSDAADFRKVAAGMGIELMPWQVTASRYLTARTPDGHHQFSEVAIVVARQNGKTTLMKPLIIDALRAGKRVMHIAQTRELPRHMFGVIADALAKEPELFPKRRGKTIWPRYGAGQEEIVLLNGGMYRIAAARTGGARGWSNDLLIIDELREMEDFDIINAAEPTLMMSTDPLTVYLSNAGTDKSIVLNSVRDRAGKDPNLAYLEWSAEPDRTPEDRTGWAQANPALGHFPSVLSSLEKAYTRHLLAGTMPIFETENLCRAVPTLQPRVIAEAEWQAARGQVPEPTSPVMAVKVDPEGRRASAVIAWLHDNVVYVRSFAEDTLAPIDVDGFAEALKPLVRQFKISSVAYDPWTDRDLARHFSGARAINGADYYQAGERFVREVTSGRLHHDDDGTIASDLQYTVRRETSNGWFATRADAERPTTAGEAAIRAVYLATEPGKSKPKVH